MDIHPVVKALAHMRLNARIGMRYQRDFQKLIDTEHAPEEVKAGCREQILAIKFTLIEYGHQLLPICDQIDSLGLREQAFDAINTNRVHRTGDEMEKYGARFVSVISVLQLEDSMTPDSCHEARPLNWCMTMAMFNEMKVNPTFDKLVHDGANEIVFSGALGPYKDRPLLERLGA